MIVWGGLYYDGMFFHYFDTGGRYNPAPTVGQRPAPPARRWPKLSHSSMDRQQNDRLGGFGSAGVLNTGGRYNPGTDVGQLPAPPARPLADTNTRQCGPTAK